jgi:ornithine cyclodeaminase/alanine dehydrogenase-like protein (mu-crystallin family)
MDSIKYRAISQEDVYKIYHQRTDLFFKIVEDAFLKFDRDEVILPAKISQIFDQQTQNRINCMPATLTKDKVAGVKWVSVFPSNALRGKQNVSGIMILSEIETGFPVAVIDGTILTSIRTAAVGCIAAKYLAPSTVESVGFIGSGSEAKMHFVLLKKMFPTIKRCTVSSRKPESEKAFINTLQAVAPDVEFIACRGGESATVSNSDIIVTAISGQAPVLKAKDITKGCLYIHVGGWEDEFEVVTKANKIVCDEWESCKHRTQTISRMYVQGLLKDEDIYADLKDIISGKKQGRENDDEFIYFNSVGLSFIDLNFSNETYKLAKEMGLGEEITLFKTQPLDYSLFS